MRRRKRKRWRMGNHGENREEEEEKRMIIRNRRRSKRRNWRCWGRMRKGDITQRKINMRRRRQENDEAEGDGIVKLGRVDGC